MLRILALSSLLLARIAASDAPVWKADFTKPTVEAAGWKIIGGEGVSTWLLRDGGMAMSFSPRPYKGGYAIHDIPFVADADLTFDVTVGHGQGGYDHFSLLINFEGMGLSFKNTTSGHKLMRYWKEQWAEVCGQVPLGKRTRIRVLFTPAENGLAQYFVDDMQSPAHVEDGVFLAPPADTADNQIRIGNYGLSSGFIGHVLHSVELRRDSTVAPEPRKQE